MGTSHINDLEAAGLLLHFLALEFMVDLHKDHVASWCDNVSTISWVKLLTTHKSPAVQHIIHALMLCLTVNQTLPLITIPIPGKDNDLADFASCSFHLINCCTSAQFLS